MLVPIAQKRPDVVAIAEFVEQLLEEPSIALAGSDAEAAIKVVLQVLLDPVVVSSVLSTSTRNTIG